MLSTEVAIGLLQKESLEQGGDVPPTKYISLQSDLIKNNKRQRISKTTAS